MSIAFAESQLGCGNQSGEDAASAPMNWRVLKAKLILHFGGVAPAANALGCSSEGIRLSAQGKCPGIRRKLEAAIGITK